MYIYIYILYVYVYICTSGKMIRKHWIWPISWANWRFDLGLQVRRWSRPAGLCLLTDFQLALPLWYCSSTGRNQGHSHMDWWNRDSSFLHVDAKTFSFDTEKMGWLLVSLFFHVGFSRKVGNHHHSGCCVFRALSQVTVPDLAATVTSPRGAFTVAVPIGSARPRC